MRARATVSPDPASISGTSRTTALARPGLTWLVLGGAVEGRPDTGLDMNTGVLPDASNAGRGSVWMLKSDAYRGTCVQHA